MALHNINIPCRHFNGKDENHQLVMVDREEDNVVLKVSGVTVENDTGVEDIEDVVDIKITVSYRDLVKAWKAVKK